MGTGAVSWSSHLQTLHTTSTTQSEYVAAVAAGQEIIWLRNLLTELGYKIDRPSTLFIDNQSTIAVARNPIHHGRMKHLHLRYYWLRDQVDEGNIHVAYIPTDQMPADVLTKFLGRLKTSQMAEFLGLRL